MDCKKIPHRITFKASTKPVVHMQGNKNTNLVLSELLPSSCFLLLGQIYRRVAIGKEKISLGMHLIRTSKVLVDVATIEQSKQTFLKYFFC
ncbi:hypothetical protein PAHAL_2G192200 [Panicum hallii]|jgi:hypothetical protein|uniref:Uncharacterized protein n=1 Tax=Panicum hallii TaxID=206008 RepID=A0A2S3GYH6_9POAL|nr:hypothetical protein PAHAL_2G192200 [Panicum hallii]